MAPRCLSYSQGLPVNLKYGNPHTARITYRPPLLSVYLDDFSEPVRSGSVDLSAIVGGDGSAWVGFTAATGGGYENHDVLSWKFSAGPRGAAHVRSVDRRVQHRICASSMFTRQGSLHSGAGRRSE